jgi:hypothetical protein
MIKIQESVPSIYYNSSRDFQLLGHLFDLVLNSTKTEADLLFNLPLSTNSDDQLLDLMTFTLGLRLNKAKYTSKQLRAICSVAPKMMRLKGSSKAIELLCTALMRADSAEGTFSLMLNEAQTELTVYITSYATCRDALQEVLPYILPAGMNFKIKEAAGLAYNTTTSIQMLDDVKVVSHTFDTQLADVLVEQKLSAKELTSDKLTGAELFVLNESNSEASILGSVDYALPGLLSSTIIYDNNLEEVNND